MALYVYATIASAVIIIDLILAYSFFRKDNKVGKLVGLAAVIGAFMEVFYTSSLLVDNYLAMKVFLAFFFSTIPVTLYILVIFFRSYMDIEVTKGVRMRSMALLALVIVDVIIQMLNPISELSMKFNHHPEYVTKWTFVPQMPYKLHLMLCYVLIIIICYYIFKKMLQTNHVYRSRYYTIILGLVVCVGFNAVCLIAQSSGTPDYSQISYSILAMMIYWDIFHNSQRYMTYSVRNVMLNELRHPLILFGEDGKVVTYNEAISFMTDAMPHPEQKDKEVVGQFTMEEFLDKWGISPDLATETEDTFFQWSYKTKETTYVYKSDFSALKDKKGKVIGRMLVFTDMSLEIDLLTEFNTKIAFERKFLKSENDLKYPVAVAVCDINRLSRINAEYGEETGDKCIRFLANQMRDFLPEGTYFARLNDALLVAVTENTNNREMHKYLLDMEIDCRIKNPEGVNLIIQSAVCVAEERNPSIIKAQETAAFALKSRKLLDQSSAHSSLMDSFAQTMMESDEGTKAHVMRTQKTGEKLAKRLDFTDKQMSDLSLLCILHDIGKLGIPLEVLNKPGKLSREEWALMKSHTYKGYRIAMASPELREIADYILHHHERWDGKGYPDGLSMESIPLLSRVIAIIDAYDAMVNDRPYHRAISYEQAKAELRRCSGTQFDPYLISEFIAMMDESHAKRGMTEDMLAEIAAEGPNRQEFGIKDVVEPVLSNDKIKSIEHSEYRLDENYRVIRIDQAFTEMTGYTEEDLAIYDLCQWDLVPEEDIDNYKSIVANAMASEGHAYLEHRMRCKDGTFKNVFCMGTNKYDVITKKPYSTIIVFDVSSSMAVQQIRMEERESAKRSQESWEGLVRKDSLTGLLNHEAFINDVETELINTEKLGCMLILDIDRFKEYNDSYGHINGDILLKMIAKTLQNSMRGDSFAGRLGGDEFAAFLSVNLTSDPEEAEEKLRRYAEDVFNSIMTHTTASQMSATISIGAAILREERSFRMAYQTADRALYKSKERGRQCLTIEIV